MKETFPQTVQVFCIDVERSVWFFQHFSWVWVGLEVTRTSDQFSWFELTTIQNHRTGAWSSASSHSKKTLSASSMCISFPGSSGQKKHVDVFQLIRFPLSSLETFFGDRRPGELILFIHRSLGGAQFVCGASDPGLFPWSPSLAAVMCL